MDTFSESIDLSALRAMEEKIVSAVDTTPTTTENNKSVQRPLRRSKTLNVSSPFTSDVEVIDESPKDYDRMASIREFREKVQRNISIRPVLKRISLKRNKSDSVIRRSGNYQEPVIGPVQQAPCALEADMYDPDSFAHPGAVAVRPNVLVPSDTERQMMDQSDFSIIRTLGRKNSGNLPSPIIDLAPSLKRQRSDDVPLMRFNSDTPMSSQETSMLNLPIISSQDLEIVDSHPLESTKVNELPQLPAYLQNIEEDDGLEMHRHGEENMDHENITFTKQNTMEMFHLEADLRGTLRDAEELNDPFSQSMSFRNQSIRTGLGSQLMVKYPETSHLENRSALDESLNLRLIASWNLPNQIEREYRKKGIVEMFEWQVKCLHNPRVLMENRNLVYSAPTSAGKTLVSEILMIKSVLERRKKALLILPFVSVVREKMFYLQDLLSSSGFRVDGFFGGYSPPGGFETTQLAVCTIEKANSIVNKLLEQNKLDTLGIIVLDEIHLIGDPNRGYILELLLAKVLYMTRKHPTIQIQVVAMSATLPKLELLCEWLDADMFVTDFRPVALNEMIKVNRSIYNNKMELIRTLEVDEGFTNDQDHIAQLCLETIAERCSVIVFCPTKERCEKLALTVAEAIHNFLKRETDFAMRIKDAISMEKLVEVKSQMTLNCPTGLDEILSKTITYGCAFHHASLTTEERDIIEASFKSGALKLIAATSTLSSGVNLPARRVIIRTPMFGGKVMNSLVYKQMIGRAGRTGKDTVGESILVCTDQNRKLGEELVMAQLTNPVTSCLVTRLENEEVEYNMNNMKRALLEIIAAGVATTNEDLKVFVHSTLFYVEHKDLFADLDFESVARQKALTKGIRKYPGQDAEDSEANALLECIKFLIEYEFVRVQVNADAEAEIHFFATRLGLACLSSSLPPADGFLLFSELQRSRQCFVLESELHAIYLVTPYSVCNQMNDIDWLLFLDLWEKLPVSLQRVGELVGIKDSFIVQAMRRIKKVDYKLMQIHKRFFIALALQELVNEMSITEVAIKFKVSRGILQSLQQMAGTFAGIVTAFCNSLNWTMLSLIVSQFKERLFFGIHPDLMDLMRIPSLNSQRARALHKNGIETLLDLAQASAFIVEKILYDQAEFQSEKQREGEQEFETNERIKIRSFFVTGRMGLTVKEGAALVIKEARDFLEMEMGMKNIQWGSQVLQAVASTGIEGVVVAVDKKAALKRHSTEELLDDMGADTKKTKSGEGSFGATFSSDLFDLDGVDKKAVKGKKKEVEEDTQIIAKDSDSDSTDEDEEVELINRSHLMNTEKFETIPPVNLKRINIIRVCGDVDLFMSFKRYIVETKDAQDVGLSVGVTNKPDEVKNEPDLIIGGNVMTAKKQKKVRTLEIDSQRILSGVSICFSNKLDVVFYLDLNFTTVVPWEMKVDFLQSLFQQKKFRFCCYDLKVQLRILYQLIPGLIVGQDVKFADPKIANWLILAMSSDHYLNHFHELANMYTPEYSGFLDLLCYDEKKALFATGLNGGSAIPVGQRTSIEAVIVQRILRYQESSMTPELAAKVFKTFADVEMPIQVVLTVMECTGIHINRDKWEGLVDLMKEAAGLLEKKIYATYGKKFNLRSTKELKRIIGVEKGSKISLKDALEEKGTALSRLIVQHRKIGGVLNKMVYPMARNIVEDRIYPNNMCFTATGRINMAEPSIQTLAKDFQIEVDPKPITVSIRSLFEPKSKGTRCFISADFCQLELRILAHFSEDKALLKILKSSHDVFQAIAAKWNNVTDSKVTEELRNDTKQICYGIIYGMGVRSLASVLRLDESTAHQRIEEFHKTYPGIRKFIEKVLDSVSQTGFVETLSGRRRYFPYLVKRAEDETEIQDQKKDVMNAQYQRQAVNTMIQGSAADILKVAIIKVEQAIRKRKVSNLRINSEMNVNNPGGDSSRVDLVLHLHDELMYEVPVEKLKSFAKILRQSMESAMSLKVPLRVKVKSGPNWGELKEYV